MLHFSCGACASEWPEIRCHAAAQGTLSIRKTIHHGDTENAEKVMPSSLCVLRVSVVNLSNRSRMPAGTTYMNVPSPRTTCRLLLQAHRRRMLVELHVTQRLRVRVPPPAARLRVAQLVEHRKCFTPLVVAGPSQETGGSGNEFTTETQRSRRKARVSLCALRASVVKCRPEQETRCSGRPLDFTFPEGRCPAPDYRRQ